MRAQLLVATTFASGLILLAAACGTETVYVYEDAGANPATSSSSSGKTSSSSGKTSTSSSGTTDDDDSTGDDDDDGGTSSSSGSTSGSTSSGGSSSGFPVMPSTKLVEGDDVVLLGIVGDDAIYRTFPAAAGQPSDVFAIPIAGGTATKLWSLGQTDAQAISGPVLAKWSAIANSLGNLEVWSRASGPKTGIATKSRVGLIRASSDGARIAFSQDAVLEGANVTRTAIGVRGIGDATNIVTLEGDAGLVNLSAPSSCPAQLSFVKDTFFAEYCLGVLATQKNALLVALPGGATALKRIDAPALDSAPTLAGAVRFSANAAGTKIVAASLGATENTGKVYTVATPATDIITLPAFPSAATGGVYTMTSDGEHVLYRVAPNAATAGDLFAAKVTAAPAVPKTASAGVLSILGIAADGHSLVFNKLPRSADGLFDLNIVDFTVDTPAPKAILADSKGLPIGFTSDSANVLFVDGTTNPGLKIRASTIAGVAKDVVTVGAPVGGRVAGAGTGLVFFNNIKAAAAGSGQPTLAQINYVDVATPAAPKQISTNVPFGGNDNEFFVSGKRVVYTRLVAGEEGIYTLTLP